MNWWIEFTKTALEDFKKLPKNIRISLSKKLKWFLKNFDKIIHQPLVGDLGGFFKLRIGDYRIIYLIDWNKRLIYIVGIRHRKDIYKV